MHRYPNPFLSSVIALSALLLTLAAGNSIFLSAQADEDESEPQESKIMRIQPTGYKPAPPTEKSREGEKLFKDLNCMQCHSEHNVGGTMGPMLDGIGARRSREFIEAHLSNSSEAKAKYKELVGDAATWSSHVRISPDHAGKIAEYLLTVPEPAGGFIVLPHMTRLPAEQPTVVQDYKPKPKSDESEAGRKLYFSQGCVACHSISNMGGWIGPRLDGIGGRRSKEYIASHITNASAHKSEVEATRQKSKMPITKLPPREIARITEFLLTLPEAKDESK